GWRDVTAAEFLADVRGLARGLMAAGVAPGDRVALQSPTRYEWTLVDYALWYVGAVTVPVYETSAPDQVGWVLADSGTRAAVVGTAEQRRVVAGLVEAGVVPPHDVWVVEDGDLDALARAAGTVDDPDLDLDRDLERRRASVGPGSLATVVYTSGTTGRPRGCQLTHGNLMFALGAALEELEELFDDEDAATLLLLPLAHVFARVVQVGAVRARVRLGHTADARTRMSDFTSFRPTFVLAVPRVFEKILTTAGHRAAADGHARRFDRAVETAIATSRAVDEGGPGPVLRLRHRVADRLVYQALRDALGGRCRYAVSGGAPLGERLGHLYRGIGLPVLEGYGLTETTGAVTLTSPGAVKIGTVGRPLPGCAVRVGEDGELHVRGGGVFAGYWGDAEATAEAIGEDGWLRTGDVGEIDDEGFVRVTGRKKEILVTAGGKNVAPTVLEDGLRSHPLVSNCMVVGDGRPFVAALVTLDAEAVRSWAREHGRSDDPAALAVDAGLHAEVQRGVDRANLAVSQAEAIRGFMLLADDWSEEGGQLTPSLKLRRSTLREQLRDEIEALYTR
ncbi:MAG: AMP-dependent synthetase/ligase, partial [Nocardioidaceae bacterium]